MQEIGYNKPLYILPFDHRATFAVSFGYSSTQYLSLQQRDLIRDFKMLVYNHFKENYPNESFDQGPLFALLEFKRKGLLSN